MSDITRHEKGRSTRHSQAGFTLIELMIVVVIIGILAALAIPRFMAASAKAKQVEVRTILKQIFVQQHAYRTEYETYWVAAAAMDRNNPNTFARIGVTLMPPARYSYVLTSGNPVAGFLCTATCAAPGLDDDATADIWTINQEGALQVTSDDAAN